MKKFNLLLVVLVWVVTIALALVLFFATTESSYTPEELSSYTAEPAKEVPESLDDALPPPAQTEALAAAQQENTLLKDKIAQIEDTLSHLTGRNESLTAQVQKLNNQNATLRKQVAELEASDRFILPIREKIDTIQASLDDAKNTSRSSRALQSLLKSVHKELDAVDKDIVRIIEEKPEYLEKVDTLKATLEQKEQKVKELADELTFAKNALTEKSAVIEKERRQHEEQQKQMEAKIDTISDKLITLSKANRKLKDNLIEKEEEIEEYVVKGKAYDAEYAELQKKKEALKSELTTLSDEKSTLQKQLNAQSERLSALSNDKVAIEKELATITRNKNELKAQKATLMHRLSAVAENSTQREKLEKKIKEIDALLAKENKEDTGAAKLSSVRSQIQQLKKSLREKEKTVTNLERKLQEVKADFVAVEKENTENKEKVEQLKTDLASRANTIVMLQEKLAKETSEAESLKKQVGEYLKELALLREDYVDSKLESANLRQELQMRADRLKNFKEELSLMMRMNSQLRERIEYLSIAFREGLPAPVTTEKQVEVQLESVNPGKND